MISSSLFLAAALSWFSPLQEQFAIHGLPWLQENKGELIRLPRRLEKELPSAVWGLGLSPSGGRLRFRTDATAIAIRLEYPGPPNMVNMHAFGQTGVDLYLDGVYRSTAIAPKDAVDGKTVEHTFFADLPPQMREVTIYLPMYKPVKVLAIGLSEAARIQPAKPFRLAKPIVFYGTSITQGACASRSGLSYEAMLERRLGLDFVNLGFSGNGKGEPSTAAMTAEIDAAAFVLDWSVNNPDLENLRSVYRPFLRTLRAKHPQTPIVAITPIASANNNPKFAQFREHIREVVKAEIAAGDKFLTLVEGYSLLGPNRLDGLVDGVHPNDLGFQWMADGLEPVLRKVLRLRKP